MKKQNTISGHVIQFCRFLRKNEFALGPDEEIQALSALAVIPFRKPVFFKEALRTTLVKNKQQLDRFDDLYLQYWSEIRRAENSKQKDVPEEKMIQKPQPKAPSIQVIQKWLHGNHQQEEVEIASYDTSEVVSEMDFSTFKNEELSDVLRHTRDLSRRLSNKKGRRFISAKKDRLIDLRKVMRRNVGKSDEFIHLSFRKRKIEKLKLVLICDVSRSMEMYSRFLVKFMYGLNQTSTKIETFVFSTRLARITQSVRDQEFSRVLKNLKVGFDGWSGGTKIGASLWNFARDYASLVLDQKTKIIILSDGWDTGDAELVDRALDLCKRKCDHIIWLNPLAGSPDFKPETACLKAAMPYVETMCAANNVEDLKSLIFRL